MTLIDYMQKEMKGGRRGSVSFKKSVDVAIQKFEYTEEQRETDDNSQKLQQQN